MPELVTMAADSVLIGGWQGWLYLGCAAGSVAVLVALYRWDVIRSGSLRRGQPRSIDRYPAIAWLGSAIGLWVGAVTCALAGQEAARVARVGEGTIHHLAIVLGGTYLLAVPLSLGVLWWLKGDGAARDLWPHPATWARAVCNGAVGLLIFAPMWVVVNVVAVMFAVWLSGETPPTIAHSTLGEIVDGGRDGNPWVAFVLLAVVVGAPVVEECLYRGLLQTGLARATGSRWAGVLLASVLFTAAHASIVPPHGLPVLYALSVAMGISYERTGNLVTPITMHVLFNAANVAMAVLS